MGCCSGGSDEVKDEQEAQTTNTKSEINLDNYTHFPGTIRQTDYTNSQIRTGWASEMDRKRNISKTIYYNPSYVVLGHYDCAQSTIYPEGSTISKYFSRNPTESLDTTDKKKNSKKDRYVRKDGSEEIEGPYVKKKRNYFGNI